MNYDEFAFFNQQLAAMLRDGIPLESGLARLSAEMLDGATRREIEALTADLAKGIPLTTAARARKFPELYSQLLEVGVAGNDLPLALTLLADYYQRRQLIWTRLKGLLVYPVIVLACAFGLSCFLSVILSSFRSAEILGAFGYPLGTPQLYASFWLPPAFIGAALAIALFAGAVPAARRALRWRLPVFREASLAQVGSAMALMLKSGVPLPDALALVEKLEAHTLAQGEIAAWRGQLAGGRGKFSDMASGGKLFPPLFVWTVGHGGEDLGAGFQRASELYQARAAYRTEMALYSVLPCAVVGLGLMILFQIGPALGQLVQLMQAVGA